MLNLTDDEIGRLIGIIKENPGYDAGNIRTKFNASINDSRLGRLADESLEGRIIFTNSFKSFEYYFNSNSVHVFNVFNHTGKDIDIITTIKFNSMLNKLCRNDVIITYELHRLNEDDWIINISDQIHEDTDLTKRPIKPLITLEHGQMARIRIRKRDDGVCDYYGSISLITP